MKNNRNENRKRTTSPIKIHQSNRIFLRGSRSCRLKAVNIALKVMKKLSAKKGMVAQDHIAQETIQGWGYPTPSTIGSTTGNSPAITGAAI